MNIRNALRSEDTEQIEVMEWCRWRQGRYPELKLLHHCPNGGSRNKREAIKLKQMGVLPGVPDLHLPVPKGVYASLYIEMKWGNGRPGNDQKAFLREAAEAGNFCVVCYGAECAIEVIAAYVALREGEKMTIPNASIMKGDSITKIPWQIEQIYR